MRNNEVSKRYAEAIYEIAKSSDKIDEVREILNFLMGKYEEEEEFRNFFSNPTITKKEKKVFLEKSFDFFSEDAMKIANYIVESDRMDLISEIKENFLKYYYKENNKLPVVGIFAKELSEEQKEKLIRKLEKKYSKKIVLNLEVDENLIGGGIIKIGSDIINGSIKHQIEEMKRMF